MESEKERTNGNWRWMATLKLIDWQIPNETKTNETSKTKRIELKQLMI